MPAAEVAPEVGSRQPGRGELPAKPGLIWISGRPDVARAVSSACSLVGLQPLELGTSADALARFLELLPEIVLVDCEPDLAAAMSICTCIQGRRGSDYRPVVAILPEGAGESVLSAAASSFDDVIRRPLERAAVVARLTLLRRAVASRRRLRLMAEAVAAAPVAVAVVDVRQPRLPLELCNPAFEALTGYRAFEVEELERLEGPGEARPARLAEAVQSSARWIAHQEVTIELKRPDGERREAELGLSPVQDAAGNVTHVVLTQTPSEPGRAPAPCSDEDSHRRPFTLALLDQMRVGVVTADRQARVSFLNRMAIETLGRSPVDCLGRELADLFGGEPQIANALRGIADGGEERVEFFYSRPDQRSLELGMTVLRVAEHAPAEMTFVTLFRDLGDRRQIDMEMRRVERLTAVGNMVAGFAHEIRSPLAGMQALCEALNAETPPEDVRHEYATRMLTLLERVEAFVRASLQFGEPKPSRRARHRPDALLEAALASLAPRWGRRGSPPPTRISGPLPDIDVDDAQVAECLLALIENALDAAGETALVELALRGDVGRDGGPPSVCFEVIDRGPGIPAQLLGRIFEPFHTTKPRGTGLGLPLAQRLVRENGGRLSVESTPGRGTTFRMHLPGVEA